MRLRPGSGGRIAGCRRVPSRRSGRHERGRERAPPTEARRNRGNLGRQQFGEFPARVGGQRRARRAVRFGLKSPFAGRLLDQRPLVVRSVAGDVFEAPAVDRSPRRLRRYPLLSKRQRPGSEASDRGCWSRSRRASAVGRGHPALPTAWRTKRPTATPARKPPRRPISSPDSSIGGGGAPFFDRGQLRGWLGRLLPLVGRLAQNSWRRRQFPDPRRSRNHPRRLLRSTARLRLFGTSNRPGRSGLRGIAVGQIRRHGCGFRHVAGSGPPRRNWRKLEGLGHFYQL